MKIMDKIFGIVSKGYRTAVGIMSGTSADSIGLVAAKFCGCGQKTKAEVLEVPKMDYLFSLREKIIRTTRKNSRVRNVCALDFGLMNYIGIWGDFFFPLIINSRSKETVPLAISVFFGEFSNKWNLISAALSLSVLPTIIIFFFLAKYFIAGMTKGAIK